MNLSIKSAVNILKISTKVNKVKVSKLDAKMPIRMCC